MLPWDVVANLKLDCLEGKTAFWKGTGWLSTIVRLEPRMILAKTEDAELKTLPGSQCG